MNVVIRRLCFISYCVFFYKLNIDCIFDPVVTGELTLASPSLLWTRDVSMPVVTELPLYRRFSSDGLVAHDHSDLRPVATVPDCSSDWLDLIIVHLHEIR
jgi:hypothetical protein